MEFTGRVSALGAPLCAFFLTACGPAANTPGPSQVEQPEIAQLGNIAPVRDLNQPSFEVTPLTPTGGSAPDFGGRGPLFSNSGAFNFNGPTVPGQASFTAPVVDINSNLPPATPGSGNFQVTVAGTVYTGGLDAMAAVFPDQTGVDFLVVSVFDETTDPATGVTLGTVVHVIVPATDFAPGATIALDGNDRIAMFAHGDISQPAPTVAAAAATGTVVFSSGALSPGSQIVASLNADFGEISWPAQPPPGGGTISAGAYNLLVDPQSQVFCDGSLIGQESAFSQLSASSAGLSNGAVNLAAATSGFDVSGAPINAAFSQASLRLDTMPDAPPGVIGGSVNLPGPGPIGTQRAGLYMMLDSDSASATQVLGSIGIGFLSAAQDGICYVDFFIELVP